MNKKALKEFAVYARNELRSQIAFRAQAFGITPKGSPVLVTGADYVEINNKKYPLTYRKGIEKLFKEIEIKGYDHVIEEVAYTWFNRLIAIRFMEVHNYLPSKVRVLSSETKGKVDPDILTEYQYTDLPVNTDDIASLLTQGNREEAFRKLLVAQCNELSEIMPFLFEKLADFTELLLPASLLHADSLINKLGKELEDENFEHVEVIGWMYQYYISEKKDEVFAGLKKNKKITKQNIPAVTQLFTPHWIVRYMVENSLGQMWLESYPGSDLNLQMKYYLEPAEQEMDVQKKLKELRYSNVTPEEITFLDPACGSGHILVYAFDLLYKIYEERGYSQKEIPTKILEKNLYGIEIDDRAAQLASFALLMKAREKTKKIFREVPKLNIFSIEESNGINISQAAELIGENHSEKSELTSLFRTFIDAKNYGSILKPENLNFKKYLEKVKALKESGNPTLENFVVFEQLSKIDNLLKQALILTSEFNVVVTNPPYMATKGMNEALNDYVKKYYPDSKIDLFAVFFERCKLFTKYNGFHAVINQHSWMFLSSFETLRKKMIKTQTIVSMIHLGPRTFEEIGGEVVQNTCLVLRNIRIPDHIAFYYRLVKYNNTHEKEQMFLLGENKYQAKQNNFQRIPGSPIAYWVTERMLKNYNNNKLSNVCNTRKGMVTADNPRFIRYWFEVSYERFNKDAKSRVEAKASKKKWFPYNKGGQVRLWYGNNLFVVNWENDGYELLHMKSEGYKVGSTNHNLDYIFKPAILWNKITTNKFSARFSFPGFLYDDANAFLTSLDEETDKIILGFLNSKVATHYLEAINPTLNFQPGNIGSLPFKPISHSEPVPVINECIQLSKTDWDSFEISWDFTSHPLLESRKSLVLLEQIYNNWEESLIKQFNQLKTNQQELNKIFIKLYELEDELISEVQDEDVTSELADRLREAKSFLSYTIGLMMGRYSLDVEGLAFAGGDWDESKYKTIQPDSDGIIPLTDTEYFEDDVVKRLQELLVVLFGQDSLAQNLRWLAESLTMKANETPVERLRRYFFDEFYADHCKIYQKRPIYWMAESGPKKGFRALFYLHRYTPETLAAIRFSYLQNLQEKLRQEQKRLEQDLVNPDLSAAMKKRYEKQVTINISQQEEMIDFDKKLAEVANQRIMLDLDDGVAANYEKLKTVLAKIK
ncbi:BREX-1 system adenine-specific DNA-methyltransferase PglX [Bacillus sp. S3]|uniref:BREX-1 system adenine-specific DNA-methyltransferase PglX n=1 Tax=Bacillus sp. S3 TaxID=486398 RepID=UPI00118A0543|nr:BREX-1 system adenine-specific DNA-methyltransferase PglX [Bacillus sp. S3]QCJ42886.1 BREX-1 system adenine-specific DNA-methyltransferase PglX [Bacillus sp. S3]